MNMTALRNRIMYKIEVEVWNLMVSKQMYYSFNWTVKINGKKKTGNYDGSYSNQSASTIRGKLKRGYALELVMEQLSNF